MYVYMCRKYSNILFHFEWLWIVNLKAFHKARDARILCWLSSSSSCVSQSSLVYEACFFGDGWGIWCDVYIAEQAISSLSSHIYLYLLECRDERSSKQTTNSRKSIKTATTTTRLNFLYRAKSIRDRYGLGTPPHPPFPALHSS